MIRISIEGIVFKVSRTKYYKKVPTVEVAIMADDQVIPVQFEDQESFTNKLREGFIISVTADLKSTPWNDKIYLNLVAVSADYESNGAPCNDRQYSPDQQPAHERSHNNSPESPF